MRVDSWQNALRTHEVPAFRDLRLILRPVAVTEGGQSVNLTLDIGEITDTQEDVDHRLGAEARDCRTADVLDSWAGVSEHLEQLGRGCQEVVGPLGPIVKEVDSGHGVFGLGLASHRPREKTKCLQDLNGQYTLKTV